MDKFKVIKDLGLVKGEYCILGGAVELLGIRESNDLDILVLPEVLDRIAQAHGLNMEMSFLGTEKIELGDVELFSDDGFGKVAQEWIDNAQEIKGMMVGSIEDLIFWKEQIMVKPGRKPGKAINDLIDLEGLEKLK